MNWNDPVYHPSLPKANLIWLRWHWFWFRNLRSKLRGEQPRLPWKLLFWLPHRYANAFGLYIGPVHIVWRRPWLAGPARFELERLDRIEALNR